MTTSEAPDQTSAPEQQGQDIRRSTSSNGDEGHRRYGSIVKIQPYGGRE